MSTSVAPAGKKVISRTTKTTSSGVGNTTVTKKKLQEIVSNHKFISNQSESMIIDIVDATESTTSKTNTTSTLSSLSSSLSTNSSSTTLSSFSSSSSLLTKKSYLSSSVSKISHSIDLKPTNLNNYCCNNNLSLRTTTDNTKTHTDQTINKEKIIIAPTAPLALTDLSFNRTEFNQNNQISNRINDTPNYTTVMSDKTENVANEAVSSIDIQVERKESNADAELPNTEATTQSADVDHAEPPAHDIDNPDVIKKKKLSLTLPLLNVVVTDTTNPNGDSQSITPSPQTSTKLTNKTKKFYESDDTFIQTIFSQTITSTTATPTDDDHSYAFEDFNGTTSADAANDSRRQSSDVLSQGGDDTPTEKGELPNDELDIDVNKIKIDTPDALEIIDENAIPPEEKSMFTYFHQTIEADEPPFIDTKIQSPSGEAITDLTQNTNPQQSILTDEEQSNINKLKCSGSSLSLSSPSAPDREYSVSGDDEAEDDAGEEVGLKNVDKTAANAQNTNELSTGNGASNCTEVNNDANERIVASIDDDDDLTERFNISLTSNNSLHVSFIELASHTH